MPQSPSSSANQILQEALVFVANKFDLNPHFTRKGQFEAIVQSKWTKFVKVTGLCFR